MALSKNHQQTLERGLVALMHLNAHGPASVSQLSKALSTPRGTAHRILETLAKAGFLQREEATKGYYLTEKVCRLSDGYKQEAWISDIATPILERFTDETKWPCALSTPSAESMVIRATTDFRSPMTLTYWPVGCRFPILRASSGVAYVAFCPPRTRDEMVSMLLSERSNSERYTRASLNALLKATKRDGYCSLSNSEFREGGLGVPLMINNEVRGGLLMRFVKTAVEMKRLTRIYVPMLIEAAQKIDREVSRLKS